MKITNLPEEIYELARQDKASWVDDYIRENGFPSCKFIQNNGVDILNSWMTNIFCL